MVFFTSSRQEMGEWWVSSVLCPHQHSIGYTEDGFFQVKRPNQQYQSTEGDVTKEKQNNENN